MKIHKETTKLYAAKFYQKQTKNYDIETAAKSNLT